MAAKAIGRDNVIAITMPCHSNSSDFEDANLVVEKFGVKSMNVDLSSSFTLIKNEIDKGLNGNLVTKEASINVKPRLRMTTLYAIAQSLGYLVIGTRKSFGIYGSDILQNGEIAVLILILLVTF